MSSASRSGRTGKILFYSLLLYCTKQAVLCSIHCWKPFGPTHLPCIGLNKQTLRRCKRHRRQVNGEQVTPVIQPWVWMIVDPMNMTQEEPDETNLMTISLKCSLVHWRRFIFLSLLFQVIKNFKSRSPHYLHSSNLRNNLNEMRNWAEWEESSGIQLKKGKEN